MLKIVASIKEIKHLIQEAKKQDKTIGLVPTMGYLHDGHLSLVKRAREENDLVVVSIFVNPTQFGVNEDYDVYPRDLDRDRALCEEAGVDLIFHPSVEEMYPPGYKTYVEVHEITERLCGASRPGHFRGVTTVVNKLLNIVTPHRAYFGLKDAQQVVVIQRMVKDLNMNVEIVPCPIVREADGLAMSSRNVYLSGEDRKSALVLSKGLFAVRDQIEKGERDAQKILTFLQDFISREPEAKVDYIEIVDMETLEKISEIKGKVLIALAVKIGKVRLIDNIIVEVVTK